MRYLIYTYVIILYITNLSGILFEYVPYFRGYSSYITLLCDTVYIIIGLFHFRQSRTILKQTFLLFLIISTFTYLFGDYSFITHLNGIREIIGLFSCIFILETIFRDLRFRGQFIIRFRKFIYTLLIIQIPVATLQFLYYGAGDNVGGTWGTGSSGTITLISIIGTYFLIVSDKMVDNINSNIPIKVLMKYFIFILPCLINETKITFILLPIMFITLMRVDFKSILILAPVFSILIGYYFQFYNQTSSESFKKENNNIFSYEFLSEYLNSTDYEKYIDIENNFIDIPRYTKLSLAFSSMSKTPSTLFLGNEYGIFKGFSLLGQSERGKKDFFLIKGSVTYLYFLFYQGGISLLVVIISFIYNTFFLNFKRTNIKNYILYSIFLIVIIFLYNDSLRYLGFYSIFFSCLYIIYFFGILRNENLNNQ